MNRIDRLVSGGFEEVSPRKTTVARVPPGMTALEALREVDPDYAKELLEEAENAAAFEYRLNHAKGMNRKDLTLEEFNEFLKKRRLLARKKSR